jgi:uncharacterized protein YgiM (DUF1202 family)
MEALALSHSFVAYESPESELQLKSLDELGLKIPNSAWIGVAGMAVALSVVSVTGEAQASGYRHHGGHREHYGERYGNHHRNRDSNSGYAEVATNGGRLNIRHRPSECSHVIGKLYNGDNVPLTGRYRNGWAQLEGGGWVSTSWLS